VRKILVNFSGHVDYLDDGYDNNNNNNNNNVYFIMYI